MRTKRILYGWLDAREQTLRVSFYPPDSPVRPSAEVENVEQAQAVAERRRATLMWIPPLPQGLRDEI